MMSDLIKQKTADLQKQIEAFEPQVGMSDVGSVIEAGDGIARVNGLAAGGAQELVQFANVGRVVNALGQPVDGKGAIKSDRFRPIERIAPGVVGRKDVDTPVQTGLKAIDSMIPLGRGQRELIIGDRQTGKTALAIDTIINQKGKDLYCIYIAIGQKKAAIARTVATLEDYGAMEYTIIVSATASDPAPLQFIAPYAGCAIGEYF